MAHGRRGPALVVIGIGNDFRGDDGVGLWVARRLMAANLPGTRVAVHAGEAAGLIESWQTRDSVVLIDAVSPGACASPGKIYRIDARRLMAPGPVCGPGTHRLGAAAAIELARALNRLPRHFCLYGIEGSCFACGSGLTPAVRKAGCRVVRMVTAAAYRLADHAQGDPLTVWCRCLSSGL